MAIQPSGGQVGPQRMTRGIRDGKDLGKVSREVAHDAFITSETIDRPIKNQMVADVRRLKMTLDQRGVGLGQMRTALMIAGALVSGPTGVVPLQMAQTLHEVANDPKALRELADEAVLKSRGPGRENAQFQSMGLEVTKALVREGAGQDVPTALFLSGAIRHHQAEDD